MTLADLPPSSSATRLTRRRRVAPIRLPTAVEPVKETRSTPGCSASAWPATGPRPVTRLNTPAGSPASCDGLGEELGDQRGVLGGLEHHRAAGRQRRGDLGDDLVQRVVPRRDRADHADRLGARWSCRSSPRRRTSPPARRRSPRPRAAGRRGPSCQNASGRAELGGDGLGDLVLAGGQRVRAARPAGPRARRAGWRPSRAARRGRPDRGVDVLRRCRPGRRRSPARRPG